MSEPTRRQLASFGVLEHAHRKSYDIGGWPTLEYNLGRIRVVVSCMIDGHIHAIVLLDGKEIACDTFIPHPEGFEKDGTPKPVNPEWDRPSVSAPR